MENIAAALPAGSPLVLQAFDPRRTLDAVLAGERKPTGDEMEELRRIIAA